MVNIGDLVATLQVQGDKEAQQSIGRFQAAIGVLGDAMTNVGGVVGSFGGMVTAGFSGFATGGPIGAALGAGVAGLGQLQKAMEWAVSEASASEQAFKNLSEAVERSGIAWGDVEAKTRSYLSELQRTTVYSDEAFAGMVERLLTFGMSYDEAMTAAGIALDLAAAKHMDLQSASDLLGKAFMGNTAILKRYGIDIEDIGGKSATFTDIMGKLNEQFGGAAQEQAKTYAGIQERLKNATSELGEKIGGMLLPGLASITEAMIPVVDWFGKGVDAVQGWLAEVGKMPEVKAATDVVNEAFASVRSYLDDLWKFIVDNVGPALQELWAAFKDVWEALSPIGEALTELLTIFGDVGNIDLLKLVLQGVVVQIRAVATIIKEVAPYIKAFADAFKAAADFITPILTVLVNDVRVFLTMLKTAFQDFYTWLIGGSLWSDLWTAVLNVTSAAISLLLGRFQTEFFAPLQSAFTGAVSAMQGIWQGFSDWIGNAIVSFQGAVSGASNWLTSTLAGMQAAASSALSGIQGLISAAWSAVTSAVSSMASTVSSAATQSSTAISTTVGALPTGDTLNLPTNRLTPGGTPLQTDPGEFWDVARSGLAVVHQGEQVGRPLEAPPPQETAITIPITLMLDGQVITKIVKRTLIQEREFTHRGTARTF